MVFTSDDVDRVIVRLDEVLTQIDAANAPDISQVSEENLKSGVHKNQEDTSQFKVISKSHDKRSAEVLAESANGPSCSGNDLGMMSKKLKRMN